MPEKKTKKFEKVRGRLTDMVKLGRLKEAREEDQMVFVKLEGPMKIGRPRIKIWSPKQDGKPQKKFRWLGNANTERRNCHYDHWVLGSPGHAKA